MTGRIQKIFDRIAEKAEKYSKSANKKKLIYISIAVAIVVILAVIFLSEENIITGNGSKEYKTSDQLYFYMDSVKSLNPVISTDEDIYHISKLIYESLFVQDDTMTPQPLLAEKYEFDRQNRSVTLKLRSGVTWQDGKDFTADDVKFTIEAFQAAGSSSLYDRQISAIEGSSVKSDDEIVIYFKDKNNMALDLLTFPILPKHKFSSADSVKSIKDDFKPVGTGPYRYEKYDDTSYLKLEPYDDYYGEKAKNDITFSIIRGEKNLNKLVESSNLSLLFSKDPERETKITKKGIKTVNFPANEVEYIGFNMKGAGTSKKRVRKAIAYAVDSKSIISECYYNSGMLNDNIYYPDYLGVNSEKDAYSYNENKAAVLLRKAGYKDRDGDGYLESAKGVKLTVNILVDSDNASRVSAAEYIKDSLDNLRIDTYIIKGDWNSYESKLKAGNYDIFLGGLKFADDVDMSVLLSGDGKDNFTGYSSAAMDRLLLKMRSGLSSEELRTTYKKIKKLSSDDLPYYCMLYRTYGAIRSPSLRGEVDPVFNDYYYGCEKWSCRYEVSQ